MKILVVGAGKVGYYLIRTLIDRGHSVSLVEKEASRCRVVAEELGILTVNGDATDLSTLVDAGADDADVVASVTGADEVNLLVCQLAKNRLGVKKVVARVNNPKNREVLRRLGVDVAISGTALIADAIEEEILYQNVRTLLKLHNSQFSLIELVIPQDAPVTDKTIKEMASSIPQGCILMSLTRDEEVILPRGGTTLRAGDTIIALVHRGEEKVFRRAFQGRA